MNIKTKKALQLILFSSIAVIGTSSCDTLIGNALENQSTQVIGRFDSTTIDVKIPAVTNFIYNPNTESMTTGTILIKSNTNAPIYLKLKEIKIVEESEWKPTLVQPDKYTTEEWRNLTKRQSSEQVALGLTGLPSDNWLYPLEDGIVWNLTKEDKQKVGTIKNKGTVETEPLLKAGNSIPINDKLTTHYLFEFGLEEGYSTPAELIEVQKNGNNLIRVNTKSISGVNGTATIAEDNFTQAIELASSGDGVYLEDGIYNIQSNDVFWRSPDKKYSNLILRKSLTLIGENQKETELLINDSNSTYRKDGQNFAITFNANDITLKNMTIRVNQENIKSLWAIFNVWGGWDGSSSKNVTIENVNIIVESYVPYLFYINDSNFTVKNVNVVSNGNIGKMFYWNFGSVSIIDSKFDIPMEGGSKVETVNSQYNLPSKDIPIN